MIHRLLTAAKLGSLDLPSRLVMAPMTRNRAASDGMPSPSMVTYYAQRASAAFIITESTQVSAEGVGFPRTPGIHSAEQAAAWSDVTTAVHEKGGRIFLQLCHAGRVSHPTLQPRGRLPVAPSAVAPAGEAMTVDGRATFVTPRALSRTDIAAVIEQFRAAAQFALAAGFDGIELHAGSGYLVDQFLRGGSNQRSDGYGGCAARRSRLLLEVVEAVASVWGSRRIGVRLSPLSAFNSMSDHNPEETFRTAVEGLKSLSPAYLHVIERHDAPAGPSFDLDRLRRIWDGAYIVNSGYDFASAEDALATGRADFVSFGRLFLANPDLPVRFARSAPLNEPDRATFYSGGERGYLDYPSLNGASE